MLGAGACYTRDIAFLKSIIADESSRNLSCKNYKRDGIHIRRGNAGNGIGGAGTGCNQAHTHFSGRAGVAVSGVDSALLMAD